MTGEPGRRWVMNPQVGRVELSLRQLEAIAWRFLGSEFAALIYANWPIDRRIDAYLARHGMSHVLRDGDAYDAVLQHVLTNIGPALRTWGTRRYDMAHVAPASRRNPVSPTGDAADASAMTSTRRRVVMPIAQRSADTVWEGALATGRGEVHARSGAWSALPVTWASRTERADGKTGPEELAAAAHASCFAMALAVRLGEHHAEPQRLHVSATVTLDEVDAVPTIVSSALQIRGHIAALDAAGFQSIVDEAAALCPVSRLFAGAHISVSAELEPV
jgi:lipoyl-dependent peroxiredoxin